MPKEIENNEWFSLGCVQTSRDWEAISFPLSKQIQRWKLGIIGMGQRDTRRDTTKSIIDEYIFQAEKRASVKFFKVMDYL